MSKEKIPKHITKHLRLKKKLKKLLDTHEVEHSQAYTKAANELLKDEEGNIDYEKLEEVKTQDKFIDKMIGHYISRAKQTFKGFKPKDEIEEDMMLRAYGTHTRGQLSQLVRGYGKKYTIATHEEGRNKLVKELAKELSPTASAHFKDEHIEDIIKYTKSGDVINESLFGIHEATNLLNLYEETGAVTHKLVKENLGKEYVKKPKKK
jgi:hypothetical protein